MVFLLFLSRLMSWPGFGMDSIISVPEHVHLNFLSMCILTYHLDFFALVAFVSLCIRDTIAGIRLVGSFSGVFGIPRNMLLNIPAHKLIDY